MQRVGVVGPHSAHTHSTAQGLAHPHVGSHSPHQHAEENVAASPLGRVSGLVNVSYCVSYLTQMGSWTSALINIAVFQNLEKYPKNGNDNYEIQIN